MIMNTPHPQEKPQVEATLAENISLACNFNEKLSDYLSVKIENPNTPEEEILIIREIIFEAYSEKAGSLDFTPAHALAEILIRIVYVRGNNPGGSIH